MMTPKTHHRPTLFATGLILAFALTLALTTGCQQPATPTQLVLPSAPQAAEAPKAETQVIRTYTAPEGQQGRLVAMLESMGIGRVVRGPGRTFVVVASPTAQQGVEAFLEQLAKAPPEPAPTSITMRYWLVLGSSAKAGKPRTDPRLSGIEDALAAIATAEGPTSFDLLEKVTLRSMDSEHAETRGLYVQVKQSVFANSSGITASLDLEVDKQGEVQTKIALEDGQTGVLAQVGFPTELAVMWLGDGADASGETHYTLYYIVQADVP